MVRLQGARRRHNRSNLPVVRIMSTAGNEASVPFRQLRPLHHAAHPCSACRHRRSFLFRNVSDCALGGEEHSGN